MSGQPQVQEGQQQRDQLLDDVGLSIGTRININYLLGMGIRTFLNSIVKQEGFQSPQEVREAALGLFQMIPDSWRIADPRFKEEYDEAVELIKIDARKTWCGVPIGQPQFKIVKQLNPHKLFHLCINLFQRRGILARTMYEEIASGNLFEELEETNIQSQDDEK